MSHIVAELKNSVIPENFVFTNTNKITKLNSEKSLVNRRELHVFNTEGIPAGKAELLAALNMAQLWAVKQGYKAWANLSKGEMGSAVMGVNTPMAVAELIMKLGIPTEERTRKNGGKVYRFKLPEGYKAEVESVHLSSLSVEEQKLVHVRWTEWGPRMTCDSIYSKEATEVVFLVDGTSEDYPPLKWHAGSRGFPEEMVTLAGWGHQEFHKS